MPLGQFSLAHQLAPYLVSEVNTEYTFAEGSLGLPIAYYTGPDQPGPTEIVRVARPRWLKIVTFRFVRQQQVPSLEAFQVPEPGEKLVWARIVPTSHQVSPNTQRVYEVHGMLVYELTSPASLVQVKWPADPVDAGLPEEPLAFLPPG